MPKDAFNFILIKSNLLVFSEGTLQLYHKPWLEAEIVGRNPVACVMQEGRAHSCNYHGWECVNHVQVQVQGILSSVSKFILTAVQVITIL